MPRREGCGEYPFVVLERTTGIEHDRYQVLSYALSHANSPLEDLVVVYEGPVARRVMPLIRRLTRKMR